MRKQLRASVVQSIQLNAAIAQEVASEKVGGNQETITFYRGVPNTLPTLDTVQRIYIEKKQGKKGLLKRIRKCFGSFFVCRRKKIKAEDAQL